MASGTPIVSPTSTPINESFSIEPDPEAISGNLEAEGPSLGSILGASGAALSGLVIAMTIILFLHSRSGDRGENQYTTEETDETTSFVEDLDNCSRPPGDVSTYQNALSYGGTRVVPAEEPEPVNSWREVLLQ
jgi:hypothetical protein